MLSQLWDHTFSEHSYGFRPGRSAHMAIEQARKYVEAGFTHVVDIDLSKFFDRVNHDRLMMRLATRVRDKRVLKLIRAYLDSGALVGGVVEQTGEGTPQGGPLSPLLANIVLDELDKELERRNLRFVRYADDVAIYVRTPKAAERVKRSVSRFITSRLKLVVNEEKSAVNRPWNSKYLGFRITRYMGKTRTGIHEQSLLRFRRKVRGLTARDRGRSLEAVVGELNSLLRGWGGYFRPGLGTTLAGKLDHWIRRRLRAYVWTQWGSPQGNGRSLPAATERSAVATCQGPVPPTSSRAAPPGDGRSQSATPARALGGSARTERYARRCLTTDSPAQRESSFSVHSVISSRTANYAIRTVSGVGGAPRKGRPYPDLCLHIRLIRHSCREIEFPRGLVFRAGHSLRIEII